MTVRLVLFDAGGTLFTERESRIATYARVLGRHGADVDEPALGPLHVRIHDEMPATFEGRPRYTAPWFREYVRRILEVLGVEADPETVRHALELEFTRPDHFVVYADVPDALDDLLVQGLRLGVVSNWSEHLPALLDALGLTRYFEHVVVSALVGADKPSRAIFEHALSRFDLAADAAVHVGDHPLNDLSGARAAGLGALLLDREGLHRPGPERIASLSELPGRLRPA